MNYLEEYKRWMESSFIDEETKKELKNIENDDKEIQDRKDKITDLQKDYNVYQSSNVQIANSIVMANHFTLEQLIRLSAFLREDEYTDENFVKTDAQKFKLT